MTWENVKSGLKTFGLLTGPGAAASFVGASFTTQSTTLHDFLIACGVLSLVVFVLYILIIVTLSFSLFLERIISFIIPNVEEKGLQGFDEFESSDREIIEIEVQRTDIERFNVQRINSVWTVVPYISFGILTFYNFYVGFTGDADFLENIDSNLIIVNAFLLCVVLGLFSDEAWDNTLRLKQVIYAMDSNYSFHNCYDDDFIYTDSAVRKYIYITSKFLAYVITALVAAIVIMVLLLYATTTTIAPTTIIIVLLLMIYFKIK